jgi:hypothetical protein
VPALSSRARQAFAAATPAYTSCPAPIGAETLVIMVTPRDRTPARCIYVDGRNASRTRAGALLMPLDLAFVLIVIAFAVGLHPETRPTLERLDLAIRFRKNGYSWHAAWHLAARR